MREESITLVADLSLDALWRYLADYRNVVRLVGQDCAAQLLDGAPGEPGARYSTTVVWEGLRSQFATRLRQVDRPRLLLYTGAQPGSSGSVRFELQAVAEDRTRVTATSTLSMSRGMTPLEPFAWAINRRMFVGMMKGLENVVRPLPTLIQGAIPSAS